MTHPIPGADSENDDTPISMSTYGSKEECEAEHARRAAAKVGANVAIPADLLAALRTALEVARHRRQHCGDVSGRELFEDARRQLDVIAAGAPAETPKQSHAEWVLRQISQLAPHQGATAIFMATEGLAAQPASAPIAGDVEKYAARYQWMRRTFINDEEAWPDDVAEAKTGEQLDAAVDAAMLASPSPRKAG